MAEIKGAALSAQKPAANDEAIKAIVLMREAAIERYQRAMDDRHSGSASSSAGRIDALSEVLKLLTGSYDGVTPGEGNE